MSLPTAEEWRAAFEATPSLAQDAALLDHVRQRFHSKYLETIMQSRNVTAQERAWEGFYFWLVFPQTSRKPFEVPPEQADALLAALRPLVARLREELLRSRRATED